MNEYKSMEETEEYGKGESDPTGLGQHEHGAKTDQGKPDLSLLLMFGRALREVGRVGTFGARKYTRGGWQGVPDGINRYTAALLRHLFDEHYEKIDKDLPVMHAAQVAWNALARLELMLREEADKNAILSTEGQEVAGERHSSTFSGRVELLNNQIMSSISESEKL